MRKPLAIFVSIVFMLLISLPFIAWVSGYKPNPFSWLENRRRVSKPDLEFLPYGQWATAYNSYISDNLPVRSEIIKAYITIWEDKAGSLVREFYKGSDGEFYGNGILLAYLGLSPLPQEDIYISKARLAGVQAWWEARGVAFLCLLTPDKPSVYPDYLPSYLLEHKGVSRREQYSMILKDTPINFIDMTDILLKHKKEYKSFNKRFDLYHWNGYGLYLTYQTVCEALRYSRSSFNPLPEGEYYESALRPLDFGISSISIGDTETVPWFTLLKNDTIQVIPNTIPLVSQNEAADVVRNNQQQEEEVMLLFADSYLRSTHTSPFAGSKRPLLPFIYNVNTFISMSNHDALLSTMEFIRQTYNPTIVVEEFAERMGIYLPSGQDNIKLAMIGEVYLDSQRYVLYPDKVLRETKQHDVTMSLNTSNELAITSKNPDSHLTLPPILSKDGRVVIVGSYRSLAATEAHVRYSQKNGKSGMKNIPIAVGDNDIYVQIFIEPGIPVDIDFYPGEAPGEYKLLPLPELERIDHNLKDKDFQKKRFVLDRKKIEEAYFPSLHITSE
ncbi:MAG: hypothetical protein LBL05_01700 [Synergistaceae bacterium]|nr:hypothetical protein [Synergistaceae bacterium]